MTGLLLAWFGLAPLLAARLQAAVLTSLPPLAAGVLSLAVLAGMLLVPATAGLRLARRPDWAGLHPVCRALLLVAAYALAAVAVRLVAGENWPLEAGLRLFGLSALAVGAGLVLARTRGVPAQSLVSVLGLGAPPLAGLALAAALAGLLTAGWPLTGALGDRWESLDLAVRSLAQLLPEEILFRGALLGALTYRRERRRGLAVLLSLILYLAFIPTQVLPGADWDALGMLVLLFPLALLTTGLRFLTGSIWAGVLVAWFYRAAPQLFTDPRDEILEPAQWGAGAWMLLAAALAALLVWLARRALWLADPQRGERRRLPRTAALTRSVALLLALAVWAGWLGGWTYAGQPGFHDDGFIIVLAEQADLSAAYDIADPVARRQYVYHTLVEVAERTQAPIRARLDELGYFYRPYYLINMIRVDGHRRQHQMFAGLPGVAAVLDNPNVRPYPSHTSLGTVPAPQGDGVEWNIHQVGADAVWDLGYRGQGVVVGGQDTGYDWTHPALRERYRGWQSAATGQASHDYNWHDAWDHTPEPHDDGDHGTHTMGIVLGRDGEDNQIGMAPEAQWMGCRNMRRGIGNPASYTECMEFLLAPYPVGGDAFYDGDVTRAPDVVNNSWGCPDYEGCDDDSLQPAMDAMRAAGILMVVSAGNDGPACGTALDPPARYDAAFSVGAADASRTVTFFSSRGPVPAGPGQEPILKPDVVAPGDQIRSSVPGGYATAGGTSMAGPHVAGLAALLYSAKPELRGDVEATEDIIRRSARPQEVPAACPAVQPSTGDGLIAQVLAAANPVVCACGGVTGVPNNVYGWGEIDALRAIQMALEVH